MKRNFTLKIIFVFSFLIASFTASYSQYVYVIVGTFSQESKAKKFTGYVNSKLFNAKYEADKEKKYFYIYILKTQNHEEAIAETKRLQAETEFKDAWIFTGNYDSDGKPIAANMHTLPLSGAKPIATNDPVPITSITNTATLAKPTAPLTDEPTVVKGKLVKFLIQAVDGKPVQGEIHDVDFLRGRDLATYTGNRYVDLTNPSRTNDPLALVCGIFGYKEVIKFMDYKDPSQTDGTFKDEKGAWVIPYKLERMKKGDVSVMYHVSFYKDAVVMLPPAKEELDELVSMMRDNPTYKIKIHGHCNGYNSRRIIGIGKDKNYFTVKGSFEHVGTAKELSKLRAEAVQAYLTDNGIDASRTTIYAWGALNMLVAETSNSARLNDRIEIEIL